MRVPSVEPASGMPVNMTPMIDVVFQLIVFFTATSTIARNEFAQAVELPVAAKGQEREPTRSSKIVANVLASGDVYVAARLTGAAEFREILAAELAEHAAKDIEVQFRADRAAPYGAVEPLLLACARAGVWQVNFAVRPPER